MFSNLEEFNPNAAQVEFEISVDPTLGRTLDNYEEIQSLEAEYYQKIPLVVAGEKAVKLQVPDGSSSNASIYLIHNDYVYRIGWQERNHPQEEENVQKMVDSFTFTD